MMASCFNSVLTAYRPADNDVDDPGVRPQPTVEKMAPGAQNELEIAGGACAMAAATHKAKTTMRFMGWKQGLFCGGVGFGRNSIEFRCRKIPNSKIRHALLPASSTALARGKLLRGWTVAGMVKLAIYSKLERRTAPLSPSPHRIDWAVRRRHDAVCVVAATAGPVQYHHSAPGETSDP